MKFTKIAEARSSISPSYMSAFKAWQREYDVAGPPTHIGYQGSNVAVVFPMNDGVTRLVLLAHTNGSTLSCPEEFEVGPEIDIEADGIATKDGTPLMAII